MAKKQKIQNTISLSDLKAYITGAVEFNADDWVPTKHQWEKIVEMIMNLEVIERREPSSSNQQYKNENLSKFSRIEYPTVDNDMGSVKKKTDMRKLVPERISDMGVGEGGVIQSGIKTKTPNIDTSGKPYESTFE